LVPGWWLAAFAKALEQELRQPILVIQLVHHGDGFGVERVAGEDVGPVEVLANIHTGFFHDVPELVGHDALPDGRGVYPVQAKQPTLTQPPVPVRVIVLRVNPGVGEVEVVGKVIIYLPRVALEGEAFEDAARVDEVVTLAGMIPPLVLPVLLFEQAAYGAVVCPDAVVYMERLREGEVKDVLLPCVVRARSSLPPPP
jgi:hypothetical protein